MAPGESLTPDKHDPDRGRHHAAAADPRGDWRGLPVLRHLPPRILELNVALGKGTLLQNVHDLPGRRDHRGNGDGSMERAYGPKHLVKVTGSLARIVGVSEVMVNSVHTQAIDQPAPSLAAEAIADDGTIEAVSAPNAPGFVLGVQWHPEWCYAEHPASIAIFRAFGEACRAYQQGVSKAA